MENYNDAMPRTEEDYLKLRVTDQIDWYDKKSASNKSWFISLKVIEIVLALFVPFLSGYLTDSNTALKVAIGILGLIVAATAGLITLVKFQENWIEYRTVAESLKLEKFLYLAKAGPYKDNNSSFPVFVERFESLISTSTKKWMDYISKKEDNKAK